VYNLLLALFLFVSPWRFAIANGAARIDLWFSSAFIVIASGAAIVTYSDWEEWVNVFSEFG
jgi:hypothetical protein